MKTIQNISILFVLILFINNAQAADNQAKQPTAKLRGPAEFQKVIDDYKTYVAKVPPKIRDEIISYRKEIARLNKEKRMLYKQLSQASQNYLKKEQQYKKKLPLNRKSLINIENPGNNKK